MAKSKAQVAERIALGLCINNPAHERPKGIQLCEVCREKDALAGRRRRLRNNGIVQAKITTRDFFEALQDLHFAGKLGMGR